MIDTIDATPQYIVVFRAPSASLFERGLAIRVNVPREPGDIVLTFQTRYLERGLENPLPGNMWIDARGPSYNLEEAVSIFGNAVGTVIPIIAFCTNAAIGDLELELAYNNTTGLEKREFLQSFLPEERAIIRGGRNVDVNSITVLMQAIEVHSEKDRITRAIAQYRLALSHWKWGHETLATAHLFMAVEALTKAIVRSKFQGCMSEDEVAAKVGIDPQKLHPRQRLSTEIEAVVRRTVLFKSDNDCHRSAKAASDGLEHGYMPFDKIREKARSVRDKTARYLREAILDLVDLDQNDQRRMLESPYDQPLGNWPVVKYLCGHLIGESDILASEGNEYPIMRWHQRITSVDRSDKGEYKVRFDENFTAQLGEGIVFQPKSFEVWRP